MSKIQITPLLTSYVSMAETNALSNSVVELVKKQSGKNADKNLLAFTKPLQIKVATLRASSLRNRVLPWIAFLLN